MDEAKNKLWLAIVSAVGGGVLSYAVTAGIYINKVDATISAVALLSAHQAKDTKEIIAKLDKTIEAFNRARFEDMQSTTQAIATLNGRTIALEVNQNNLINSLPKR